MDKQNMVGELKTLYQHEEMLRKWEAEKIAALEEKLTGMKLAHSTGLEIVPVVKIDVSEIAGISVLSGENKWDYHKIDMKTPIIIDRCKNVIAGPIQFMEAKDKGHKKIDAVYIDSLKGKYISIDSLRRQFQNEKISTSFAYSLYSAISYMYEVISYKDFVENIDELFCEDRIIGKIGNYVYNLDDEYGV